jgi:hypothetical protein
VPGLDHNQLARNNKAAPDQSKAGAILGYGRDIGQRDFGGRVLSEEIADERTNPIARS